MPRLEWRKLSRKKKKNASRDEDRPFMGHGMETTLILRNQISIFIFPFSFRRYVPPSQLKDDDNDDVDTLTLAFSTHSMIQTVAAMAAAVLLYIVISRPKKRIGRIYIPRFSAYSVIVSFAYCGIIAFMVSTSDAGKNKYSNGAKKNSRFNSFSAIWVVNGSVKLEKKGLILRPNRQRERERGKWLFARAFIRR